ncbi:EF-hand and coiled-coil domain-containing protein 1 [Genypterus blacodes]|uniref:EF-hand and coiled-coil domain-containing protein 1 n=1 Tax=Genypterus blacodes TaxID=154954 RepID=UPI003F76DFAD
MERVRASPRAARKSEWLRSALAHHHCPDPGAENEIIVLATGIDQYLQEVFHHLAHTSKEDTVSAEDFTALCSVLGLTGAEEGDPWKRRDAHDEEEEDEDEFKGVCSELPDRLYFKDFHSRLCGYFRVRIARKGAGESGWRMPVTADTELVEREIRLRWPRVRRRKSVSFDLSRDQTGHTSRSVKGSDRTGTEEQEPDEAAGLRELVEDLRSALQGSDARCLALEVALQRQKTHILPAPSSLNAPASTPTTSITLKHGKLVPTNRIKGQLSSMGGEVGVRRLARRRDITDPLVRELKLIRSSRDGQLEEAIKFNQRLEEELQWAYKEVRKLHGGESALRRENAQIRRRAEEAREALSLGLQRVRQIQEQAQAVPQLQTRITQLEAELQQYRSCCTCTPALARPLLCPTATLDDPCGKTECLQRAVEGRAASDEEEEDRGRRDDEGQCCLHEVKKLINQLHGCNKGCQNPVVHQLLSQSRLHDPSPLMVTLDSRGRCSLKGQNQDQLEVNSFDKEKHRPEEEEDERKERLRLSLLEAKLADALRLLLQLRNKNVSRRALGKIVMDALDVHNRSGHGRPQVLQVADAFCVQLSSSDLLGGGGGDGGAEREEKLLPPSSGRRTSSVNTRLISSC